MPFRFYCASIGWLLLLTVVCPIVSAQSVVTLKDESVTYTLDSAAHIFIDSLDYVPFEKIKDPAFQNHFLPSGKKSLTFGYLEKPIWIKLAIVNQSKSSDWYLEIPAPYLAYLTYYFQDSGRWQKISCGYYLPHAQRGIPHTGFVFPIKFDSINSPATIYISVTGLSPKNIPINVMVKEKFIENARLQDVWYGLFFGVLIVMMLYNLIISARLRDINYLIYIFTILCTLLIFGSASGYLGKYLWPNHPEFNFYAGRLTLAILIFLVSLFSKLFLETKNYSKTIHFVLSGVMLVSVICFVLVITSIVPSAANNLTSFAAAIFLISGLVCWINGNRNAGYYVAAWIIYLMGGLSSTLRNSGLLPVNFWTNHLAEIGAASETILIALALSARYSNLKKENEEAQLALIDQLQKNQLLQKQATHELEYKVSERTQEIKQQNEKLSRLNLLKDKLFSIISHDIKSPLSQLSGALYLVERDMITKDEIKELMPKIRRSLINNENFLSELLAWTKNQLEGGGVNPSAFNLRKAIAEVLSLLQPQYEAKKIQLNNYVDENTTVFADSEMIKSVVRNLIVNAIKFTNQNGTIEVSASIRNQFATLQVKDNGCGIGPERQATLFTMEIQSTRGTANEKGSGIGLLICKDFVESNGGTIWAESQVDQGSTFAFTIPVEAKVEKKELALAESN